MIISLTGFMGCGKSSVGRKLSRLLCCRFMDLDSVIEETSGRSIPEIFASDGEAAFRNLEKTVLSKIISGNTERLIAPLAPSHFVGPSPYAGVRKCQFRKTASPQLSAEIITDNNSLPETTVLALGGGTVMTPECAEMVHEKTLCIYLRASMETLVSHLESEASSRPLLSGASLRERISELMTLRSATYEKTAHVIIDTDGRSIDSIAQEIKDIHIFQHSASYKTDHFQ